MTGSNVESDSGSLLVRNSVEDWRYIFEICDPCLEPVVDDILADSSCEEDSESLELESEVRPFDEAMLGL